MEPTIETHLLFVTMQDGAPVLNWRCRKTGEPIFVHDYHDELISDWTLAEEAAIKAAMRDTRVDPDLQKVKLLAQQWDFSAEAKRARDLRETSIEEVAEIIRTNRHRSDLSLARMIVDRDYQPE